MTDALKKLIEAVEAGTSPMWTQVTSAIGLHPDNRHLRFYEAFKGSLDAAKSLHEALLPGYDWHISSHSSACVSNTWNVTVAYESADNPARAWLICILKAKLAGEERNDV